jgi:hypothetical protein
VHGTELKAGLKAIVGFWESLAPDRSRRLNAALGDYPPRVEPDTVGRIWRDLGRTWTPNDFGLSKLTDDEREAAIAEARQFV